MFKHGKRPTYKWLWRVVLIGIGLCGAESRGATQLPQLNWPGSATTTPFADWVNVKKDVTPAAVGDGAADDTAALQAALNMLAVSSGSRKVVYLPPGTYRITSTLQLTNRIGTGLIGHGRDTTIRWAGAAGGRMFWSDGATHHRFVGIVWDGQGVAAVGVDHDASSLGGTNYNYFETSILHRDEEYRGFTDAGIRIGQLQGAAVASAEIQYYNCLFKNSYAGIKILWANDYDNWVEGCDFLDNTYGIYTGMGNYNLYNCHFERSATADVYAASHTSSIRRCTSQGSYRFVYGAAFATRNPHCIQDCWVDTWTATNGAIYWASGGPLTILDSTFTNGPNTQPPVQLTLPSSWGTLKLVTSNNQYAPATSLTKVLGGSAAITDVTGRTRGGIVDGPAQSFFSDVDTRTVPAGRIYDVVRSFGAVGNGSADDTQAIQNCLNAAAPITSSTVYLPCGTYKITSPLIVPRGSYRIAGSGFWSRLAWYGSSSGGPILQVDDPKDLTVENLTVQNCTAGSVQRIQQTSTQGLTCRSRYDRVWFLASTGGVALKSSDCGIKLLNLPSSSTVLLDNVIGVINLSGSSRATVVGNITYGRLLVSNANHYAKSGFAGWAYAFPLGIEVKDNQDLILGDVYTEADAGYFLHVSGDNNTGASGRVTLGGGGRMSYFAGVWPATNAEMVNISDYLGRVFVGANSCNPYTSDGVHLMIPVFNHSGASACDLTVAGMGFNQVPVFNMGSGGRQIVYANGGWNSGTGEVIVPDTIPADGLSASAAAFDDLAELSQYHNWGAWVPTQSPSALTITAVSDTVIRLAWQDKSPNEQGFTVERSTNGMTYTAVTSVGTNVTTVDCGGLNTATHYYFRVCAYNLAGSSLYSNSADAVTLPDLSTVLNAMDSKSGDPTWDSKADVDNDGEVTSMDLSIVLAGLL